MLRGGTRFGALNQQGWPPGVAWRRLAMGMPGFTASDQRVTLVSSRPFDCRSHLALGGSLIHPGMVSIMDEVVVSRL